MSPGVGSWSRKRQCSLKKKKKKTKQVLVFICLFIYLGLHVCVLSHSIMFFHPPGKAQKGYAPVKLELTTLALLCMYYCISTMSNLLCHWSS